MRQKVVILGCTGMLGHKLFERLSSRDDLGVYATARSPSDASKYFSPQLADKVIPDAVDANDCDALARVLVSIRPDVVINCIGLIKQLPISNDPIPALTINSLFPHRLALICKDVGTRMIHISTDCVFNGDKGNYVEDDFSDARDLYGRSKYLGEVNYEHCVTLRTSIIGHELSSKFGLVEWFLNQKGDVKGFAKAIYTGFPTIELARIISDYILPDPELKGVYHVSSDPVSKYEILKLVAEYYGKKVDVRRDEEFCLDRSLDSTRFRGAAGYSPPAWPQLIEEMHSDYKSSSIYRNSKGME